MQGEKLFASTSSVTRHDAVQKLAAKLQRAFQNSYSKHKKNRLGFQIETIYILTERRT
jgi:hypothetical protein